MMKRLMLGILVLVMTVAFGQLALADHRDGHRGGHRGHFDGHRGGRGFFFVPPPPFFFYEPYPGPVDHWIPGHYEYDQYGHQYWVPGHYERY